jgi:glycosyltransferase involved in cell wall biosynthesis
VQERSAALGLANVRFRPYQPRERLAQSLGACDAHLVTLRPELEGLVVPSKFYGILAAGRAVLFVGAPEGDLQRRVREAACGAVLATADAAGLAQQILRLAAEPVLAQRWGANARALFERRFSKPLATAEWERQLHEAGGWAGSGATPHAR